MHTRFLSLALLPAFAAAQVPSHPIPVNGPRAHVYDPARSILYTTTANGIRRWDTSAQAFLPPLLSGLDLRGIDITPDYSSLIVCDATIQGTEGFLHRIDLASGAATTLSYTREFGEAGSWEVTVFDGGSALVTTSYSGSGWTPLRELDLATNQLTIRTNAPASGPFSWVRQNTQVVRGGDRSLGLLLEDNISSGPGFTFDSASGTFPAQRNFGSFHSSTIASVNRDGSLLALELGNDIQILDPALGDVTRLTGFRGGVIFHPLSDLLYAVDATRDVVEVFDTTTWNQVSSFPVGQDVGDSRNQREGELSIADDGSYLFLTTATGVRAFQIGLPRPVVASVTPRAARWDAGAVAVTVRGRFFNPNAVPSVLIGGLPATNVRVLDGETLRCTAPADDPGPKDVVVDFGIAPGTLQNGFARTPALVLGGDLQVGGVAELSLLVTPGDFVGGYYDFPPAVSATLPFAHGTVCLLQPTAWFEVPSWPLSRFDLVAPIPADPALAGVQLLLQGLAGSPQNPWAVTNCATLGIR